MSHLNSHSSDIASTSTSLQPVIQSIDNDVFRADSTVISDNSLISRPIDRPKRQSKAPSYLSDYHCALAQISPPLPPNHTTPYPISSVLSYDLFKSHYCSYILSYSMETEPKTFKQAITFDKWKGALNEELHAMELNRTLSHLYHQGRM